MEAANGQVVKRPKRFVLVKNNARHSLQGRPADISEASGFRGPGIKLWTAPSATGTPQRGPTNAHVKNTIRLLQPEAWMPLAPIRDLIIEDEDDVMKVMPSDLAQLRGLKSLKFSWSQCKTVPDYMGTLPLRYLSLRENKLQNVDIIVHLVRLLFVDLSNNMLVQLPRDIGRLDQLQVLNLSGNKLKELPQSIGQLPKLQELNCSSNRLRELPASLGQLRTLMNLDLSFNLLQSLPESLGGLSSLVELRVTNNQLKDLPMGLAGAKHIRHLFLAGNQFKHVPAALQQMPHLQSINLRQNFIEAMQHRLEVTTLLLDQNNFKEIPDAICDCQNLETLSLQFNEIKVVNPAIGRLRALRVLYLGGNEFSHVPDELCRLANLRHLSLNSTEVQTLPSMFDTLRCLNFLDLSASKMVPPLQEAYRNGVDGVMKYVRTARETGTIGKQPAMRPVSAARPGSGNEKRSSKVGSGKEKQGSGKRGSEKGAKPHSPVPYVEEEKTAA